MEENYSGRFLHMVSGIVAAALWFDAERVRVLPKG